MSQPQCATLTSCKVTKKKYWGIQPFVFHLTLIYGPGTYVDLSPEISEGLQMTGSGRRCLCVQKVKWTKCYVLVLSFSMTVRILRGTKRRSTCIAHTWKLLVSHCQHCDSSHPHVIEASDTQFTTSWWMMYMLDKAREHCNKENSWVKVTVPITVMVLIIGWLTPVFP